MEWCAAAWRMPVCFANTSSRMNGTQGSGRGLSWQFSPRPESTAGLNVREEDHEGMTRIRPSRMPNPAW